jgi:hypothetical protein
MINLIEELFACDMPGYTPEGKKTFIVLDDNEVEGVFR